MLGQERLLSTVDRLLKHSAPALTIIVGPESSGKGEVAKYIAKKLNASFTDCGIKADDVRKTINTAYRQSRSAVYMFSNADKMSPTAKNALLKVTEEPPRQAHFVLTLTDVNNTLETLRSRGTVLYMQAYTPADILKYCKSSNFRFTEEELAILQEICVTPGEVEQFKDGGVADFYSFVETVANYVKTVSTANALKIGTKLKIKDTDTDWDIALFMRTLMLVYGNRMKENPSVESFQCVKIVSKYLSQLRVNGINKAATVDTLILELRSVDNEAT